MEYVGCTPTFLRQHLQSQFTDGMTWENHGQWHIDHRRPCASFDLTTEEEKVKCFHWSNLQPMWGPENISKGDNYDEATFSHVWDGEKWVQK